MSSRRPLALPKKVVIMTKPIAPEDILAAFGTAPRRSAAILDGLNPAQREAVETIDGPLVIRAGAGTGKTTVLTRRMANIIDKGKARPEEILAVTFTRKAAGEMRQRLGAMLGDHVGRRIHVGNFHAISAEMLRRHAALANLPARFFVLDDDGQREVIAEKALERGFINSKKDKYAVAEYQAQISSWKEDGLDVDQVLSAPDLQAISTGQKSDDPGFLARASRIFEAYQDHIEAHRWCDFADLVLHMVRIFRAHPQVLATEAGRFRYVMADEFQDTSPVQNEWLTSMARGHRNICVVGDTDQSIYEWRNARPEIMMNFPRDWPGCREVTIDTNYRSTQEILDIANTVVEPLRVKDGLKKRLQSPRHGIAPAKLFEVYPSGMDEAAAIARSIEDKIDAGTRPSEIAVLCRSGMIITGIERALRDRRIRYIVAGAMKFTEREEVKDAFAYLQVAANPMDHIAFERIAGKPSRGVGLQKIVEIRQIMMRERVSLVMAVSRVLEAMKPRSMARVHLQAFHDTLVRMEQAVATAPDAGEALNAILELSGYLDWRRANEKDPQMDARLENLALIMEEAAGHRTPVEFLEAMALQSGGDTSWGEDCVVVSTIHASKGLEFDIVFTPAMEEGVFPNARSEQTAYGADEERRLAHVAWTRARTELHVSCAGYRMGRQGAAQPSRYLAEAGLTLRPESQDFSRSLVSGRPTPGASTRYRMKRRSF